MGRRTEPKLTSRERLNRGLRYTAVGPVDITRGLVGVSVHSAESLAAGVRRRARDTQEARERLAAAQEGLAHEVATVQQVVAELPQVLQEVRKAQHRRHRRLFVFGFLGLAAVGGAVAFTIVRRSAAPEPSTLPPSVEVAPKL